MKLHEMTQMVKLPDADKKVKKPEVVEEFVLDLKVDRHHWQDVCQKEDLQTLIAKNML